MFPATNNKDLHGCFCFVGGSAGTGAGLEASTASSWNCLIPPSFVIINIFSNLGQKSVYFVSHFSHQKGKHVIAVHTQASALYTAHDMVRSIPH